MAADRPLPIRAGRIRLDAPHITRLVVQTSGRTTEKNDLRHRPPETSSQQQDAHWFILNFVRISFLKFLRMSGPP